MRKITAIAVALVLLVSFGLSGVTVISAGPIAVTIDPISSPGGNQLCYIGYPVTVSGTITNLDASDSSSVFLQIFDGTTLKYADSAVITAAATDETGVVISGIFSFSFTMSAPYVKVGTTYTAQVSTNKKPVGGVQGAGVMVTKTFAYTSNAVMQIGSGTVDSNNQVVIPLTLYNALGPCHDNLTGVCGFDFNILYDTSLFSLADVTDYGALNFDNTMLNYYKNNEVKVNGNPDLYPWGAYIAYTANNSFFGTQTPDKVDYISRDGVVANLIFTVAPNTPPGIYPISFYSIFVSSVEPNIVKKFIPFDTPPSEQ